MRRTTASRRRIERGMFCGGANNENHHPGWPRFFGGIGKSERERRLSGRPNGTAEAPLFIFTPAVSTANPKAILHSERRVSARRKAHQNFFRPAETTFMCTRRPAGSRALAYVSTVRAPMAHEFHVRRRAIIAGARSLLGGWVAIRIDGPLQLLEPPSALS